MKPSLGIASGAWALAVMIATAGAAAPPDALSEARLLQAALDGVTGLVASFTQTLESPSLPRPQVERGTVYLLRPGRMRWEYEEPKGKLAIAAGGRSELYLPEERQLLRAPLDSDQGEPGMALLLRGGGDLAAQFDIGWAAPGGRGGARLLKLTPRSRKAAYTYLLVGTGPDHLVTSLAIVDPLGSTVTYRFSRARRVPTLDEDLFRLTPPPGVEVQDLGR